MSRFSEEDMGDLDPTSAALRTSSRIPRMEGKSPCETLHLALAVE